MSSRKRDEKIAQPIQNIPFNVQFGETEPPRLSIEYPPRGQETAAAYQTIWTPETDFSTNEIHNIALAWDTIEGNYYNKTQVWLDVKSVIERADWIYGRALPILSSVSIEERKMTMLVVVMVLLSIFGCIEFR